MRRTWLVLVTLALVAGGCGGGDSLPAPGAEPPGAVGAPSPTPTPPLTPTPAPTPSPAPTPTPDLTREPPGTTVRRQSGTRFRFTVPLPGAGAPDDVIVFDLDTSVADAMGKPVTEFALSTRVPDGLLTLVDARVDGRDVVPQDERCAEQNPHGAGLAGSLTRFDTRAESEEMRFASYFFDERADGCFPVDLFFGFSAPVE